ncbi:hypothetical protein J4437_00195 [Candidatus Woesearchaeota archaeon]|nr:hypothetical protein [Candidatus Woesearchaeota archaeon]
MKTNIPCPCGGFLELKKEQVLQEGIDCGILDVEICNKCLTQYLPEESMLKVEEKLKKAGLWGVERKEIKFWKTGKAVTIRLPTSVVKNLHLSGIEKGYLHAEGKRRLIIEI